MKASIKVFSMGKKEEAKTNRTPSSSSSSSVIAN